MTDENKDIAKPEVLNLTKIGDETLDQSRARAVLAPQNLSTIVLSSAGISGVPFNEIVHELNRQTVAINNGDMTRVENMLTAQAHTLDALFTSLANTALQAKTWISWRHACDWHSRRRIRAVPRFKRWGNSRHLSRSPS
ncbi:hypothetical protein [Pseudomonas gingeri]|uniref:Uncharacterized protein n=1 Tax=Pseudomonas gingeri TaxID=117681 RepID=A0A7Y8BLM2_9PSED|nr:hypothetical protein [Pseudomonas gingeri]NWB48254.1 hypothetical protein [Pseudomonas gingeri]